MKSWIISLTGTALLTCAAMMLTPEGRAKKAVRIVCGFAMICALLSPLRSFDYGDFAGQVAELRREAEREADALNDADRTVSKLLIQEECEAYIMDKGNAMGLEISHVRVALSWSGEGYWLPVGAELGCARNTALERVITGDLGVPQEEIVWDG